MITMTPSGPWRNPPTPIPIPKSGSPSNSSFFVFQEGQIPPQISQAVNLTSPPARWTQPPTLIAIPSPGAKPSEHRSTSRRNPSAVNKEREPNSQTRISKVVTRNDLTPDCRKVCKGRKVFKYYSHRYDDSIDNYLACTSPKENSGQRC